jgi:hypothetical protein
MTIDSSEGRHSDWREDANCEILCDSDIEPGLDPLEIGLDPGLERGFDANLEPCPEHLLELTLDLLEIELLWLHTDSDFLSSSSLTNYCFLCSCLTLNFVSFFL